MAMFNKGIEKLQGKLGIEEKDEGEKGEKQKGQTQNKEFWAVHTFILLAHSK